MYRFKILSQDTMVKQEIEHVLGKESSEPLCDIVFFDKNSLQTITEVLMETTFLVLVLNDKNELMQLPVQPNLWIFKEDLKNLPLALEQCKKELEIFQSNRYLREISAEMNIHNDIHEFNLDMIREGMRTSASEIRDIFEQQVASMRVIHTDIAKTMNQLTDIGMKFDIEDAEILEGTVGRTQIVLERADTVIKQMFSFISILQCEDRITQMLNGISSVIDEDKAHLERIHAVFNDENVEKLVKKDMAKHYTIQEQRDLANGEFTGFTTCKTASLKEEEAEILLF